jgi:hypothetical protein
MTVASSLTLKVKRQFFVSVMAAEFQGLAALYIGGGSGGSDF